MARVEYLSARKLRRVIEEKRQAKQTTAPSDVAVDTVTELSTRPVRAVMTDRVLKMLTPAEVEMLEFVLSLVPSLAEHLVLFTDPGKDPDDTLAAILTAAFKRMGIAQVDAAVTTLGDGAKRDVRADYIVSIFTSLAAWTRVASGDDYTIHDPIRIVDDNLLFDYARLYADSVNIPEERKPTADSQALLLETLENARDHSLISPVIAGMTDLAKLVKSHPELAARKFKEVCIQGGLRVKTEVAYEEDGFTPKMKDGEQVTEPVLDANGDPVYELNASGCLLPDERAFNNTTDQIAAGTVYQWAQKYNVPLTIVPKEAAYAAPLSYDFYVGLAGTKNRIATDLAGIQALALERLWEKVKAGHKNLTREWFFKNFTDIKVDSDDFARMSSNDQNFAEIWEHCDKLNAYDPYCLVASIPALREAFFTPKRVNQPGKSAVWLIGGDEINNADELRILLSALAKFALGMGARAAPGST